MNFVWTSLVWVSIIQAVALDSLIASALRDNDTKDKIESQIRRQLQVSAI